jgi:hypothetical protein
MFGQHKESIQELQSIEDIEKYIETRDQLRNHWEDIKSTANKIDFKNGYKDAVEFDSVEKIYYDKNQWMIDYFNKVVKMIIETFGKI